VRRIIFAAFLLLSPTILPASTIHVPDDQPTIQDGIDAASPGDTVSVACGTYFEHDIVMGEGVVLRSESGTPECVTIDVQQTPGSKGIICLNLEQGPTIEGFTITGGMATGAGWPTAHGGGLFSRVCNPSILNCIFIANHADSRGGGVSIEYTRYGEHALLAGCNFIDNTSEWGGGLLTEHAYVDIVDCEFNSNTASLEGGGARLMSDGSHVQIQNCLFYRNSAIHGGAITTVHGMLSLRGSTLYQNEATDGSGVYSYSTGLLIMNSILAYGLVGASYHGGIVNGDMIQCNNIYGNEGGDWTNWFAELYGVNGNISENPLFCDPDMDDFSLRNDSPCAPANNSCGILMGALPVGCTTSTETATWSKVKALY